MKSSTQIFARDNYESPFDMKVLKLNFKRIHKD